MTLTEADRDARAVLRLCQRGLMTTMYRRITAMEAKVKRAVEREKATKGRK